MSYLAMRPDVTAAERSLAAAYYNTASARAAFYPNLSISFTGGFTNQLGTMIKNPGEWFYNLAGSLTAPCLPEDKILPDYKPPRHNRHKPSTALSIHC